MTEKNRKQSNKLHLLGVLMVLLALVVILPVSGPQSVAADSPAESQAPETVPEPRTAEAESVPETEVVEEPLWEGPVPESTPVEDTYFDDVVFLGDSRTDGLRLYGGMTHGTFLFFTGATVESVFTKEVETQLGTMPLLDALAEMEYGRIYVMLGVNELGWKGTDIFRNQSAALIQRLQEDHPEAEIVIQSILPVSAKIDEEGRYVNNQRIAEYNQVWLELAEQFNVNYLNIAEVLLDENGQLPSELTYDGVHLNKAGCRVWLDYMRSHTVGEIGVPAVEESGETT